MHCHPVSRQSVYQFVFTHPARTSKELTDIAAGFFRRSTIRLTLPTGYTALPNCLQVLPPSQIECSMWLFWWGWNLRECIWWRVQRALYFCWTNVNQLKVSNSKLTSKVWTEWLLACTYFQNVRFYLETPSHQLFKNCSTDSTKLFFSTLFPCCWRRWPVVLIVLMLPYLTCSVAFVRVAGLQGRETASWNLTPMIRHYLIWWMHARPWSEMYKEKYTAVHIYVFTEVYRYMMNMISN